MQALSTSAPLPLTRYDTGEATTPIQTQTSAPQPVGNNPPAPAPASPQRQKVTSWKERPYTFRQGDDYANLSRTYYNNSGYAAALREWNRDPERASSEAVRSGQPLPGDKIAIPAREALEQVYPNLIPARGTQLDSGAAKSAGTQQTAFISNRALPAATPIETVVPKLYRVRGTGEALYTIAQKTLNDGTRWEEIARLNPTLSSELPVPPETLVYLPAGASVPAANAP